MMYAFPALKRGFGPRTDQWRPELNKTHFKEASRKNDRDTIECVVGNLVVALRYTVDENRSATNNPD